MNTTEIDNNALRLELTFGNANHLSLMIKNRLTNEEMEYLKSVFALVLESTVEAVEATGDEGGGVRG